MRSPSITCKAVLTACLGLLLCHHLMAQPIKVDLNQKVIYTDSLSLPRQTSINMVLTMMSELLQRPGEVIYSNYSILVSRTTARALPISMISSMICRRAVTTGTHARSWSMY